MTFTPQNCQGHQNKMKFEKLSQQEEPKETWLLNVMWFPKWDPGTTEGHQGKNWRNPDKIWTLVNNNIFMLAH